MGAVSVPAVPRWPSPRQDVEGAEPRSGACDGAVILFGAEMAPDRAAASSTWAAVPVQKVDVIVVF